VLAPTPFAHQVNIRLQQCCVVLVGVYPATPVVCWRFRCFLPGSLLGTTGDTARSPPGLGVGVLCCHIWWSSRGRRTHFVFFEGPLGEGRVDLLPQRFLPSRCNPATPGWRAPSWGPMDRGGRRNPSGRSGMTSGGGGVDLPPGVDPPTSGDPLSQSDGDAGDPWRGSLFRPQALPVGPSGVRTPRLGHPRFAVTPRVSIRVLAFSSAEVGRPVCRGRRGRPRLGLVGLCPLCHGSRRVGALVVLPGALRG